MQKRAGSIIEEYNKMHNLQHNKDTVFHHLVEEVGELARELHHEKNPWRAKFDKDKFSEELIDVLLQVLTLAQDYNVDIEDTFNRKMKKLRERYQLEEENPELKREFVATVYIVRDNKVLLIFHNIMKRFIPIGGHVEENETPDEAVIREAKEETGFDITLIPQDYKIKQEINYDTAKRKYLPQCINIGLDIINPKHHHINIAYAGKILSGTQLEKSDEGTELRWFSAEELKSNKEILNNVREEGLKAISIALAQ